MDSEPKLKAIVLLEIGKEIEPTERDLLDRVYNGCWRVHAISPDASLTDLVYLAKLAAETQERDSNTEYVFVYSIGALMKYLTEKGVKWNVMHRIEMTNVNAVTLI